MIEVRLGEKFRGQGLCKRVYEELAKTIPGLAGTKGLRVVAYERIWQRLIDEGKAEFVASENYYRMR